MGPPQSPQHNRQPDAGAAGEFFIPDLCGARQVFVIVLLAQLLVLVYTLAASDLSDYDWGLLATSSLFVQWIVLLSTAMLCLLRGRFARLGLVAATVGSLLLVSLVTALITLGRQWLLPGIPGISADAGSLLRNLLVALVVSGIVLRYFYLQRQVRERERAALQARVDALRARIRPHFLFNTLNSIASLIAIRPAQAEGAVEDLAELFRASLREDDGVTTLGDEMRLCELYLGIEQLRLGDRLAVEWQVPDALLDTPMPALILQPLIENAVYHGIARLPGGGTISVQAAATRDQLQVEVRNPMPADAPPGEGLHMALENIEQRLQGLFAGEAGLVRESLSTEFRIRLHYPLEAV